MKRTFGVVAMMAFFFAPQFPAQANVPMINAKALRRRYIHSFVDDAAAKFSLQPALIRAVIHVESNFNYRAVSHAGAQGLMQIMPRTALKLREAKALEHKYPRANILAGAHYLRRMINRFQGNLKLALAAYNAGPKAVERYHGIPPYPETREYVKKVLGELHKERN